jgi:hypothetical protein
MPQLDIPVAGICGLATNGELHFWLERNTSESGRWYLSERVSLTEERVLVSRIEFIDPDVSSLARLAPTPLDAMAHALRSCFASSENHNNEACDQTEQGRLCVARIIYVTDTNVAECHVCDVMAAIPVVGETSSDWSYEDIAHPSRLRTLVNHIGSIRMFETSADGMNAGNAGSAHVHPTDPTLVVSNLVQQIQICTSTGDIFLVHGDQQVQRWCWEPRTSDSADLERNWNPDSLSDVASSPEMVRKENTPALRHLWRCSAIFNHRVPITCIRLAVDSRFLLVGDRDANLVVLRGDSVSWHANPQAVASQRVGPASARTVALASSPHAGCAFVITDDFCESGCVVQLPSNYMDASYIAKALCKLMQTREGLAQNTFDLVVRIRQEPGMFKQLARELERVEAPRRCFTVLMFCHTLLAPLWMALNAVSMPIRILESRCNAMSFANRQDGSNDQRNEPPEMRMARLCSLVRPRVLEAGPREVDRMFCAVNKILCMAAAWIRHASLTTMLFMRADELPSLWAALRRQDWAAITSFVHEVVANRSNGNVPNALSTEQSDGMPLAPEHENAPFEFTIQSLGHDFLRVSFHFVHDPYYARLICIACSGAIAVLAGLLSREPSASLTEQRNRLLFGLDIGNRIATAIHDLRDAWRGMDADLTMLLRNQRISSAVSASSSEHVTDAVRSRLAALKSAIRMRMNANVSLVQRLLENPRYALHELEDCAGLYGGSLRGFLLSAVPLRSPRAALARDVLTCVPLEPGVPLRRCSRTGLVSLEPDPEDAAEDSLLQSWRNTSPFGGVWYVTVASSTGNSTGSVVSDQNHVRVSPTSLRVEKPPIGGRPSEEPDGMDTTLENQHDLQIPELDDLGPEIDMRHVASALKAEEFDGSRGRNAGQHRS